VLAEGPAHAQHPAPSITVGEQVRREPQRPEQALIGDKAPGLQQSHGCGRDLVDNKAVLGQQLPPLGNREWASIDFDRTGESMADNGLGLLGQVVGDQREFVDGVATAGPQQPGGLSDDGVLGLVALHGQHRLADDHISAGIGQPGLSGVHNADLAVSGDHRAHRPRGVGVLLGTEIGARLAGDDLRCGAAQPRRQLDHIAAGHVGAGQQRAGEFHAARAKHPLAEASQQPVARHRVVAASGERKRRAWHCAPIGIGHQIASR
jgi:hypothetical protein